MEPRHLDILLDVFIGVAMLTAVGIFAWVWFRWDRLNGDRPPDKFEAPPLDPYSDELPPDVEKRRTPK